MKKIGVGIGEVETGALGETTKRAEDDQEFVVTAGGGHRMNDASEALIPIIGLTGAVGEDTILQEERLVSGLFVLEEMGLLGLL